VESLSRLFNANGKGLISKSWGKNRKALYLVPLLSLGRRERGDRLGITKGEVGYSRERLIHSVRKRKRRRVKCVPVSHFTRDHPRGANSRMGVSDPPLLSQARGEKRKSYALFRFYGNREKGGQTRDVVVISPFPGVSGKKRNTARSSHPLFLRKEV